MGRVEGVGEGSRVGLFWAEGWVWVEWVLGRGAVEAAESAHGPSAGREGGRAGLGLRGKKGWARKLRTGPVRDFGLGFQGMLGWVWVEFGLGFLGLSLGFWFLILISYFKLTQPNRFEFKQNLNSTTLCTQANKKNAPA